MSKSLVSTMRACTLLNRSFMNPKLIRHMNSTRTLFSHKSLKSVCLAAYSSSTFDFESTIENVTVDKDEVAKFGAMSQEWWDPRGSFKLLHGMNLPRVEYLLQQLKENAFLSEEKSNRLKPLEDIRVLDVGCGGGILSESLARLGAIVTAVDASPQNISIAKLHKARDPLLIDRKDRLQYCCMTSHDLLTQMGPESFDIVCSLEVIEHVQQPQEFINCIKELVKPNGPVFISTISRNPLSYFLTIGMAEHLLRLTPVGTHHFEKYINPDELATIMDSSGLAIRNMTNIHFNPFHGAWILGDSIYPRKSYLPPVNYISMATRTQK